MYLQFSSVFYEVLQMHYFIFSVNDRMVVIKQSIMVLSVNVHRYTFKTTNYNTPKIRFQGVRNLFFAADLCSLQDLQSAFTLIFFSCVLTNSLPFRSKLFCVNFLRMNNINTMLALGFQSHCRVLSGCPDLIGYMLFICCRDIDHRPNN